MKRALPLLVVLVAGCADRPLPLPAACMQTGLVCVYGPIVDLTTRLRYSGTVPVGIYSFPDWLTDAQALPLGTTSADGDYRIDDFPPPATGRMAVTGSLGDGLVTGHLAPVDAMLGAEAPALVAPRSLLDAWTRQTGLDYAGSGALLVRWYTGPHLHLLAGEQLLVDGAPANAVYLSAIDTVDPQLTETGDFGAALVVGDGMLHAYTGSTGGDQTTAGSRAGLLTVLDLYDEQ